MKPKMILKIFVDLAMTVLLFLLMAYLLVGETAHEWMGLAVFILFLFHHVLNRKWYGGLFRGNYTPLRVLQTLLNVLLLAAMIGLMVSGVILSRVVFDFLPVSGGTGFARTLHMLASYWGFIFMSLHLGHDHGNDPKSILHSEPFQDPDMDPADPGGRALCVWSVCLCQT